MSRCPFSTSAINVFILFFQLFVILSSPGEDQFCFFFRAFKYHLLCDLYFIFTELLYLSRRFVSSPPGKLFTRVLPYRPPKFFKINLCCCCDLLFIFILLLLSIFTLILRSREFPIEPEIEKFGSEITMHYN